MERSYLFFFLAPLLLARTMYPMKTLIPLISPLRRRNFRRWVFQPLHRRNICRWFVENKPLHRLFFVICSDLYTGGMKLKNLTSTRLNEVSEKWRSVSFTDAVVHCPDFGSKSKVYRSRPSPHNLWRQQGVQDVGLSSILF
ncbi:hypothetical protein TNCV_2656601 [Trichonephila clavipes]|nr:hypothetical protein TNCV_2656601 [Trichonephila clavipes]